MRLDGRGVLITGASMGLGRAIAEACAAEGADVFLCARGAKELERAQSEIAEKAAPGKKVHALAADVSKPDAVEKLVQAALKALPNLQGLVNCAGIYGPPGALDEVDWAEWVKTLEINLFGTVALCRAVLPAFRKRGYGKIINLSGGGASGPLPRMSAYATSKGAIVHFTETLATELKGTGIDVNALAPGPLNTRLLDQILEAGPDKVGPDFYARSVKQKKDGGAPMDKGAALCAYLLSSDGDGITGKLLSAQWDPWQTLREHRADLEGGDIYALRRIVPKDRGLKWGS
ncbi:MAG: SDR family oxidoreductase [Elusimicrobia bacterium]|nr:SDR family oxidoreductase [Elusimicrobiota bacterium]